MQSIQDRPAPCINGFITVFFLICIIVLIGMKLSPLLLVPVVAIIYVCLTGFVIVQPNEAMVLIFFGKYVGTIKEGGLLFTIPFTKKIRIPLKLVNFVTDRLKVNDLNGNPIEIGAVIVWRVDDAAKASFNVDYYQAFVANQSDIAIRTLAAHYPYDSENEMSLRGHIDEIAAKLKDVLQDKLSVAGIVVEETRLSHLAYASEIAAAMLKRQQAAAIFQARQYMVENTLAIIDDVIKYFETKSNLTISDDKKAELINSLLIVMTSDKESTPVLNLSK